MLSLLAGVIFVQQLTDGQRRETQRQYTRAVHCWIDLKIAEGVGPAVGVTLPTRVTHAREAWETASVELGVLLNKDKDEVKADAKSYFEPLYTSVTTASDLAHALKPVLDRAAVCDAQFSPVR